LAIEQLRRKKGEVVNERKKLISLVEKILIL